MYPESTTDSPARLSLRQTGSPGMIYSARYGSPKRQLQFYRYLSVFVSADHFCHHKAVSLCTLQKLKLKTQQIPYEQALGDSGEEKTQCTDGPRAV
uniref:Uncharacterized protein n=1 Tax=Mastacembelus armatus TaxID=205130 RepID=A0A7N8XXV5_9TELE